MLTFETGSTSNTGKILKTFNLILNIFNFWVEIPNRNRHSKALVGVMYRSAQILCNSHWLERLETLLGHLTATWDGLPILTGDMNIDMLQPANSLTKQYQAILDVLGLQQMIKPPTRVTKTSNYEVINRSRCYQLSL